MSNFWGNSRWRLRLPQELKSVLEGNLSPVQSQIDSIQSAIAGQVNGMDKDSPTRKGLEFISKTLESAQDESGLIIELAKEAARTASSVNRGYNSRTHKTPGQLRAEANTILAEVSIDEEVSDFVYGLKYVRSRMEGTDEFPLPEEQPTIDIKQEYIKTCKMFVDTMLPDFAEDIVYKFASAVLAKESDAPLANLLRYEISADLKEYDNLPIPNEFQSQTDIVQPQKPSYKGKPFETVSPSELGFSPSSGNLAPAIGKLHDLKIAVVMFAEAGAVVVLKAGQVVSATVGAITSLTTSIAAWLYLAVLTIVVVVVAYFIKKAIDSMQKITGQYIYLFGQKGDEVDISFATLDDSLSERNVNEVLISIFNEFQSHSRSNYNEVFAFVADDEEGEPENRILDDYWITSGYIVTLNNELGLSKLDKTLWKPTFEALNAQVDEFYRFK